MFEFISRSLKLAGDYKNKIKAGIFFIFIQNFSMLVSFIGIYFSFKWLDNITPSRILTIFIILAVAFLFIFLTSWVQNALIAGVFFTIYKDYRLTVGEKLKKSPMGYFSEQSLSKILGCFTNVLKGLENFSQITISLTISGMSATFFLLIGMFSLNYKIGLLTMILSAIAWFIVYKIFKVAKDHINSIHVKTVDFTDALVDGIRGIPILRSFPSINDLKIKKIHGRIYETSTALREKQCGLEKIFTIYSRIFGTVLNISSLITILFTCYLFTQNEVELYEALTLSAASFMLFGGIKQLENAAILLVKSPSDLNYIEEVLDIPELREGSIDEVSGIKTIEFEHVDFSYENEKKVINDLSFTIDEGSKVAIVGPSGSGKTTIINLISRFYDVDSGSIKIANTDIRDYKVNTLLKNLSLVFQDVYLFSDTVKNNIRFAKPDATEEEIIEVSKKAMCHDFIMNMPNGYDTLIGEGGSNISGGEKQRISIARALLKDADIVLLDEATSSVDPENEYEILKAIDELCKGKTVISIAHRLSTVKNADNILVIKDGQLVQSGKHVKLMEQPGIYYDFIESRKKASTWSL